jgi:ABC-type Na+ efflux pump permease subunit
VSFSPTRVRVILVKELTDYRRNRFVVVFATIVFPLIFIAALTAQLLTAPAAATSSRLDARIGLSLLYMLGGANVGGAGADGDPHRPQWK